MKKLQTNKVITLITSALLFAGTSLFADEMIETSEDVFIEDASINAEDLDINNDFDIGTALAKGDKCGGDMDGKCGEGKDKAKKCGEGKCGEGKCGEGKDKAKKCGDGKCGEGKDKAKKCGDGKCGDGKCGGDDDDDDDDHEEKCGEGKCG